MVVRLVAHSNFLFLNFSLEFFVDMKTGTRWGDGVVLKDPAHVVEQAGGRQHGGGWMEVTLAFQEELRVLVPLGSGASEPHHRLELILGHSLSSQV